MKIQLKSDEDLTIVTKGGGNIIVPNNTDTSTDKTFATVDQIGPGGGDKANAASLADPYESDHSSAYVVGDYVTHEGTLYKCKSDTSSPPGEWDDNNWDAVAVTDEMGGGGISAVKMSNGTALTPDTNGAVTLPNHKIFPASWSYSASGGPHITLTPTSGDFALEDGVTVFAIAGNGPISGPTIYVNVGGTGNKNLIGSSWTNSPYWNLSTSAILTGEPIVVRYHASRDKWILLDARKAPLDSPAFTGTPTAPTATAGTNTTQIATTEFVQTAIGDINSVLDAINGEEI